MISFKKLGSQGRLGNQLFQYAFLRLTAQRLGVKFYCPKWVGDEIFLLNDASERADSPQGINKDYVEPQDYFGFNESALKIEDNTDISGWFQTEKYFDEQKVRKWYVFREERFIRLKDKYPLVDFSECTGLHVRLKDFISDSLHYVLPAAYYRKAISFVKHRKHLVVFSDDPSRAKLLLKGLSGNIVYIEGCEPSEQLYLETKCHDFISAASTFGWWGAWLNSQKDKIIVVPKEGPVRPGAPVRNNDFWPDNWIKIKVLNGIFGNYNFVRNSIELSKFMSRIYVAPFVYFKKLFKSIYSRRNH